MPPKAKGSSKAASKAKTPPLIDGLSKDELSKEQLEEHIVSLRADLDREREERNYFQLERDRIRAFWDNTERQLQEAQTKRENAEKDIEEDEWRHQVEIKVYKQKVKHLLCEHQNTVSDVREDSVLSAEDRQKKQEQLEIEIHDKLTALVIDVQRVNNEHIIKELERRHHEEMTTTRNGLEKRLNEIEATYDARLKLQQQEIYIMRKNELNEKEDDWNRHITGFINGHNEFLGDANILDKGIQSALDFNTSLKQQIRENKKQIKAKNQASVLKDSKNVAELLLKVKEDHEKLERKMKYNIMKECNIGKIIEKDLYDIKKEHKALEQQFRKLQLQRDERHKAYCQSTEKVQEVADQKGMLLDAKLAAMTESLEKTNTQLQAVLSATDMDQTALSGITDKIEEKLNSMNISIKSIQYNRAQMYQARKDLMLIYELKVKALGFSVEELQVVPPESSLSEQSPGEDSDAGSLQN